MCEDPVNLHRPDSKHAFVLRMGLGLLLAFSALLLVVRGIWRGIEGSRDFGVVYLASRNWLLGQDPYDADALRATWQQVGDGSAWSLSPGVWPSLYPAATYLLLAPISILPWPAASWLWLALSVVALALVIMSLNTLAGWLWHEMRAWVLAAVVMGFGAVHTNLAMGQLPLVVLALSLSGLVLISRFERPQYGALFIGLACALKPHVAGMFVLYLIFRRQYAAVPLAVALPFLLLGLGIIRLEWAGVEWLSSMQQTMRDFTAPGAAGDPSSAGRDWHLHLNLAVLLHLASQDATIVHVMQLLVVGLLVLLAWRCLDRHRDQAVDWVGLGLLGVVALLSVYHRYYDAVVLVLLAPWLLRYWHTPAAWGGALLLVPFWFNGPAALAILDTQGYVPARIAEHAAWQGVVLSHQNWLLLGLAGWGLMIGCANRNRTTESPAIARPA